MTGADGLLCYGKGRRDEQACGWAGGIGLPYEIRCLAMCMQTTGRGEVGDMSCMSRMELDDSAE